MSVYYRPALRGFGLPISDFSPSAPGATFTEAGAIPQGSVLPDMFPGVPGSVPDPGPEFQTPTHRAPPAEFTTHYTLAKTQLQQQQQLLVQQRTTDAFTSQLRLASAPGGSGGGNVTLGTAKPGGTVNVPGGSFVGGGSDSGGAGGGSDDAATSANAFQSACAQVGGSYSAVGPCCALSDGRYVGLVSGAPALVDSCGGGGAAGVAVAAGAGLLALLFLLK